MMSPAGYWMAYVMYQNGVKKRKNNKSMVMMYDGWMGHSCRVRFEIQLSPKFLDKLEVIP